MTDGFGAGSNGPLLISVDLSKQPAKADQQDRQDQPGRADNKDKANKQAQQQEQQLEAQGMPPDQAQAQVQPQLNKQLDQISRRLGPAQEGRDRHRPRLQDLRDGPEEDERRQVGHRAAGQQGRAPRRC